MIQPSSLPHPLEQLPETRPVPRRTSSRLERPKEFWAIVLAGGEGVRLRSLVRRALGDDRPKQYARLLSDRSLLGQTLDRVSLGIPTTSPRSSPIGRSRTSLPNRATAAPPPPFSTRPTRSPGATPRPLSPCS